MQKKPMSQFNMFKDETQFAISNLDAGQLEHFYFMSCTFLERYRLDRKRAGVVIQDELEGKTKMIAENVDQLQVSKILDEITNLMGAQLDSGAQSPIQLNQEGEKMSAQVSENLIYKGQELNLSAEPPYKYLETIRSDLNFVAHSSANLRGYVGTRCIEDVRMYPAKFNGAVRDGDAETTSGR